MGLATLRSNVGAEADERTVFQMSKFDWAMLASGPFSLPARLCHPQGHVW
jgi:hypothetical protein